jgi:hypothetical protein
MQAREGEFHLRLHAYCARYPAPWCPPGQVVQQRSLAHAWVAAYHQGPALAGPDRFGKAVEHLAFASPVRQPFRASPGHREPTGVGWKQTTTPPPATKSTDRQADGQEPGFPSEPGHRPVPAA